jgi:hypothetical protein
MQQADDANTNSSQPCRYVQPWPTIAQLCTPQGHVALLGRYLFMGRDGDQEDWDQWSGTTEMETRQYTPVHKYGVTRTLPGSAFGVGVRSFNHRLPRSAQISRSRHLGTRLKTAAPHTHTHPSRPVDGGQIRPRCKPH